MSKVKLLTWIAILYYGYVALIELLLLCTSFILYEMYTIVAGSKNVSCTIWQRCTEGRHLITSCVTSTYTYVLVAVQVLHNLKR